MENYNMKILKKELIIEIGKQTGSSAIFTENDAGFLIELGNKSTQLYIANAYQQYILGVPCSNIVKTAILPVFGCFNSFTKEWELIKEYIYPQIKPLKQLTSEYPRKDFSYKEGPIDNTGVCYIVDKESHPLTVTQEMINYWGITLDSLHKVAIKNLTNKNRIEKIEKENFLFYISETYDGYDAARLLTVDFHKIAKTFEGKPLIGIPHRDLMIIFDSKQSYVEDFENIIHNSYEENPYGISNYIYSIENNSFKKSEDKLMSIEGDRL